MQINNSIRTPFPCLFNSFTPMLTVCAEKYLTFTEYVTINSGYPQDKLTFANTKALRKLVSTFLLLMQMMFTSYLHLPVTANEHCDNLYVCWRNK